MKGREEKGVYSVETEEGEGDEGKENASVQIQYTVDSEINGGRCFCSVAPGLKRSFMPCFIV